MFASDEGYVKYYRKIRHHWLREKTRETGFDPEHAFYDLIMEANYKTEKFSYKNRIIDGQRGCVYRSKTYLAKQWGWSEAKVRRFLKMLESDGMIDVKTTGHLTVIKVVNYDVYQGPEQSERRIYDGNGDGIVTESRRICDGIVTTYNKDNKEKERIKKEEETRAREAPFFPDGEEADEEELTDDEWEDMMRAGDENKE